MNIICKIIFSLFLFTCLDVHGQTTVNTNITVISTNIAPKSFVDRINHFSVKLDLDASKVARLQFILGNNGMTLEQFDYLCNKFELSRVEALGYIPKIPRNKNREVYKYGMEFPNQSSITEDEQHEVDGYKLLWTIAMMPKPPRTDDEKIKSLWVILHP